MDTDQKDSSSWLIRRRDMAFQRELRRILKEIGLQQPWQIQYIRRGWGEPIDAAVVYSAELERPHILAVDGEEWRWLTERVQ